MRFRNAVHSLLRCIPSAIQKEPLLDYRLQVSATAVSLVKNNESDVAWTAAWADICRIIAFKVDLLTFDRIYLGICTEAETDKEERERRYHMCHEELRGWPALVQAIQSHYGPGAVEKIYSLMVPPFEESSVVAWERASDSSGLQAK